VKGGGSGEYIYWIISLLYLQPLACYVFIFVILESGYKAWLFTVASNLFIEIEYDIPMFIANTHKWILQSNFEMVPLILT